MENKKGCLGCSGCLGTLFTIIVIIAVISPFTSNSDDTKEAPPAEEVATEQVVEEKQEEPIEPEKTFDNIFEEKAYEQFGDDLLEVSPPGEDGSVYIEVHTTVVFSVNSTMNTLNLDIVELSQKLKSEDFSELWISAKTDTVDVYGNEGEGSLADIVVSKEALDKINVESFNVENLEKISEAYSVYLD